MCRCGSRFAQRGRQLRPPTEPSRADGRHLLGPGEGEGPHGGGLSGSGRCDRELPDQAPEVHICRTSPACPVSRAVLFAAISSKARSTAHLPGVFDRARAQDQANWHRLKPPNTRRQARTLRIWQLVATGFGVILSAIAGFVPSWRLSTWTAAATTIAAAVGAHLAATQHQRIAATYATTSDQLERLIAGIDPDTATPERQAQFVADVERILLAQKQGWIDLISTGPTAR